MPFHISLVGRSDLSVEIYRQIRDAIVNGVLRPGDRLPASRELAATLSVARMTVTVAYERLVAEEFVVSRVGDGTFVSPTAVQSRDARARPPEGVLRPRRIWREVPQPSAFAFSAVFDFRTGIPDASLFPYTHWRRLVARALRAERSSSAVYADPAGHPALRASIARHVGISRGLVLSADDVTVTSGTQQALDLIARVLIASGDRVAVEDPGYTPARRVFEVIGALVQGVPVDGEGLVVQAIPRRVRAIYVTPSHQCPLGVSMTLARRRQLLAWADRHDAAVIEDDYDSEFRFTDRPLEPLRTLDAAGRVIYVGSFSKTLLPSLRLGFVIAPRSLRASVQRAKFLSDWHSPTLLQAALARFIDNGDFARHLRRVNEIYRERHGLIMNALSRDFGDDLEVIPSASGLHMAALARKASVHGIEAVANRARAAGVAIQTAASFAAGSSPRAGIILGYGGIATKDIERGLFLLRTCLKG